MKNLYASLFLFFLTASVAMGQSFKTDFGFFTWPQGWEQQTNAKDGGWQLFNPKANSLTALGFVAPSSDYHYAYTTNHTCQCDKTSDILILPGTYSLDEEMHLSFSYFMPGGNASFNTETEQLSVLVSSDKGQSWVEMVSFKPTYSKAWEMVTAAFGGKANAGDVRVAIRYSAADATGYGVAIDDLELSPASGVNIKVNSKIQADQLVYETGLLDLEAVVSNLGDSPVQGLEIRVKKEGQLVETIVMEDVAILPMENLELNEELALDVLPGEQASYQVEIIPMNGDVDLANNELNLEVAGLSSSSVEHGVVGEEATGTWCGWCPRGAVFLDQMTEDYDNFIGVAVHNGDPMVDEDYDAWMSASVGGYPSGHLHRKFKDVDPSAFEQYYKEVIKTPPGAELSLDIDYNEVTRALAVTVTADFSSNAFAHRLNVILTEDGVTGTGSGWAQANYYSGGGNGSMGGYENLPNPVPANQMVYDHVAREIIGSPGGAINSLPFLVSAGQTHSYTFNTTLESDWNPENIHVIGVLHNDGNKTLVNATSTSLLSTSNEDLPTVVESLDLYPNPTADQALLRLNLEQPSNVRVQVVGMLGQTIADQTYGSQQGDQVFPILTAGWTPGIYQIVIHIDDTIVSRPLHVAR